MRYQFTHAIPAVMPFSHGVNALVERADADAPADVEGSTVELGFGDIIDIDGEITHAYLEPVDGSQKPAAKPLTARAQKAAEKAAKLVADKAAADAAAAALSTAAADVAEHDDAAPSEPLSAPADGDETPPVSTEGHATAENASDELGTVLDDIATQHIPAGFGSMFASAGIIPSTANTERA